MNTENRKVFLEVREIVKFYIDRYVWVAGMELLINQRDFDECVKNIVDFFEYIKLCRCVVL